MGSNADATVMFGVIIDKDYDMPWDAGEDGPVNPEDWMESVGGDKLGLTIMAIGNMCVGSDSDFGHAVCLDGRAWRDGQPSYIASVDEWGIVAIDDIMAKMDTVTPYQIFAIKKFVRTHFPHQMEVEPRWLIGVSYG